MAPGPNADVKCKATKSKDKTVNILFVQKVQIPPCHTTTLAAAANVSIQPHTQRPKALWLTSFNFYWLKLKSLHDNDPTWMLG